MGNYYRHQEVHSLFRITEAGNNLESVSVLLCSTLPIFCNDWKSFLECTEGTEAI